jgi:hypothetical protein
VQERRTLKQKKKRRKKKKAIHIMSLINISRTKLLQIQPVKICDRLCLSTLADPSMDNIQKLDSTKEHVSEHV